MAPKDMSNQRRIIWILAAMAWLGLVVFLFTAGLVLATEYITNGDFSAGGSGWTVEHATVDFQGSPNYNVHLLYNQGAAAVYQEVTVGASGVYSFGGQVHNAGQTYLQVMGAPGSDVGWDSSRLAAWWYGSSTAYWHAVPVQYVMLPAGATVWLRMTAPQNNPSAHVYYDDMYLSGPDPWVSEDDPYNILTNGEIVGNAGWDLESAQPCGVYEGEDGNTAIGSLRFQNCTNNDDYFTQEFDVTWAEYYTLRYAMYRQNGQNYQAIIEHWTGADWELVDYDDGFCAWDTWCDVPEWEIGYLSAGSYRLRFRAMGSGYLRFDDVELVPENPPPTPTPTPQWGGDFGIYFPMAQDDAISHYQAYSDTTAYGLEYQHYNIWRVEPDSMAYAIARMEITEIGESELSLGGEYYLIGQINVWPDTPSTTLTYDGLSAVYVEVGDFVGAECPIGMVANRWQFGPDIYHLLLKAAYPDPDTDFNPEPYMTRWPDADNCADPPNPPGPQPQDPASGLWLAECKACPRPGWADVLKIGLWIDWLSCTITNLFTCFLVRWINTLIAFVIGLWQFAIMFAGWFVGGILGLPGWLVAIWWNLGLGLANLARSAILALIQSGPLGAIWAGLELVKLLATQAIALIAAIISWLGCNIDRLLSVNGLLRGLLDQIAAVFNAQPVDIFGSIYGIGDGGAAVEGFGIQADPPGGGTLADQLLATGPNSAKMYWILLMGLGAMDAMWSDTGAGIGLTIFSAIALCVLAWNTITWTIGKIESLFTLQPLG